MSNTIFEWFFSAIYVIIAFGIVYLYFFKIVPLALTTVKAWNLGDIIRITIVLGLVAVILGCLTVIIGDWIFSQVLDSLPRTRMAREINRISGGFRFPVDNSAPISEQWSVWGSASSNDGSSSSDTGDSTTPPVVNLPAVEGTLKPNALQLWATSIQTRFNPTGNPSDNAVAMYDRDLPVGVTCDVFSTSEVWAWARQRQEAWELVCSDDNFKTKVTLQVNGTAARGLTGGSYQTQSNPKTIYGTGIWPENTYQTPPALTPPTPGPAAPVGGGSGAVPAGGTTHKVGQGESLGSIADKYGISVKALLAANSEKYPQLQTNPNLVALGWELIIPTQ